jgi:hypothetical protein
MPNAFLLRFQEFCIEDIVSEVRRGNQDGHKGAGEQSDNDAVTAAHAAMPSASWTGGTMTKTSIGRETGGQDQDRCERLMRAIPGSGTRTKVEQEQPDHAPCETANRAVPWPPTLPMAGTETSTAIRAEADDNDPKRAFLHAVPKCF